LGTIVNPLDLRRNMVLERFEFTIGATNLSLVHEWIYQTLQTITSPLFNEFVIWLLGSEVPLFGCLLGQVRTTQRGCSERERERDRGPSSVGSEPPLHDARTRGERGKSGDRHED